MSGEPRALRSLALSALLSQLEVQPPVGPELSLPVREESGEQTEKTFARILVHLLSELEATKLQLRMRSG